VLSSPSRNVFYLMIPKIGRRIIAEMIYRKTCSVGTVRKRYIDSAGLVYSQITEENASNSSRFIMY